MVKVDHDKRARQAFDYTATETTEQTALMLDRWQSYADALKEQLWAAGKTPLSWECFQRSKS